jgi:vacuolar-type H+-ATPase subunit C/Vma6
MSRPITYHLGRIKAREKDLLGSELWRSLRAEQSLPEFLGRLQQTVYAAAAQQASFSEFEQALYAYWAGLKKDLCPNAEFPGYRLIWLWADIHNLKVILKRQWSGKEIRYLLPMSDVQTTIPEDLRTVAAAAQAVYAKTKSYVQADEVCDRWYMEELTRAAKEYGPSAQAYVAGIIAAMKKRATAGLVAEDFEYMLDNTITATLAKYRYVFFDIAPILMFFRQVAMEIQNLRTCFVMHASGLPVATLREMHG